MFSVATALDEFAAAQVKDWGGHDRLDTVGASESGQCERKIAFAKTETPPDENYSDGWGAKERGNIMERDWWEPALQKYCRRLGYEILMSGSAQKTLVDGFLSATPDGLIINAARDALEHLGIPDLGAGRAFVPECKSIDPRANLVTARAKDVYQVIIQMGLIRAATNHRPEFAVISYMDASFWDQVREFPVKFDEEIYERARDRARRIMGAKDPLELRAEGAGVGSECDYCPFTSRCREGSAARVPKFKNPITEKSTVAALKKLVAEKSRREAELDEVAAIINSTKNEIIAILESSDTKGIDQDGIQINLSAIKGRETLNQKALKDTLENLNCILLDNGLEEHQVDLAALKTKGNPYTKLTTKMR